MLVVKWGCLLRHLDQSDGDGDGDDVSLGRCGRSRAMSRENLG
jgi:hypothetical protein